MPPWWVGHQRLLNARAVPARSVTREHPAGLTARQTEIHRLLAEGLTYREIAARLYISTRTVEHHVSAVLAKYAVGRREDLPPPDGRHPTD